MSSRSFRTVLSATFVLLLAQAASAHPGHGAAGGIIAGAAHPISGIDHILAMLAVGICAAQIGGRALWLLPLTFLASMLIAGFVAMGGMQMPMVEQGIAASLVVLGLLIAGFSKPAGVAVYPMVALFAVFHGSAHGAEVQPGLAPAAYAIGFLLTTAFLHAIGIGAGMFLRHQPRETVARVAGCAVAMCGLFLI